MCTPMALGILSFATGAAQSVLSYVGQKQMADENKKNAEQAWRNNQEQITKREMQEADALSLKQQQNNLAEAEASAETSVSAAAANVSGISVDNLLADVERRAARNRTIAQSNTDMLISQLQTQRKGYNAQAQSQINSVPQPSPFSLVVGLGNAGLGGYNTYVKAKATM